MCTVQKVATYKNRGEERGREKQRTLGGKTAERAGGQCVSHIRRPPPLPVLAAPPVRPLPHPAPGPGHAARALGRARVCRSAGCRAVAAGRGRDGSLWRGRPVRGCGEGVRGRGVMLLAFDERLVVSRGGARRPPAPAARAANGGAAPPAAHNGRGARWMAGASGSRQRGATRRQSGSAGVVRPPRPFRQRASVKRTRPCGPPPPTEGNSVPVRFRGKIEDSQSSNGNGGGERGRGEGGNVGQHPPGRGDGDAHAGARAVLECLAFKSRA